MLQCETKCAQFRQIFTLCHKMSDKHSSFNDVNVSTKEHCISQTQVTKYAVTHACFVGTHEDVSWLDSVQWGGDCWNTVHGAHKSTQGHCQGWSWQWRLATKMRQLKVRLQRTTQRCRMHTAQRPLVNSSCRIQSEERDRNFSSATFTYNYTLL